MTCALGCNDKCGHCPKCGEWNAPDEIENGKCHECGFPMVVNNEY